jgi:hypothetical protein
MWELDRMINTQCVAEMHLSEEVRREYELHFGMTKMPPPEEKP